MWPKVGDVVLLLLRSCLFIFSTCGALHTSSQLIASSGVL